MKCSNCCTDLPEGGAGGLCPACGEDAGLRDERNERVAQMTLDSARAHREIGQWLDGGTP